ncbi:MAG: hypothetical protein R3325_08555 [Thermoanaerobaculia bacterium]|nr:hypothetical protein [Thermoanaerobaculia bacterium]
MTDCERCEITLSGWLDGEERDGERLEALDHLTRCEACRRFYREGRALSGLVAAAEGAASDLGAERWERIVAAAAETPPAAGRGVPAWALRAAAALLLAAGLVYALWSPSRAAHTEAPAADVELVLEEDAHAMTETRFVELTTEVLRADRRFHRALYEVMEQVVSDTSKTEASADGSGRESEIEESAETGSEKTKPERA